MFDSSEVLLIKLSKAKMDPEPPEWVNVFLFSCNQYSKEFRGKLEQLADDIVNADLGWVCPTKDLTEYLREEGVACGEHPNIENLNSALKHIASKYKGLNMVRIFV